MNRKRKGPFSEKMIYCKYYGQKVMRRGNCIHYRGPGKECGSCQHFMRDREVIR